MARVAHPQWTPEQLDHARTIALANFVAAWGAEGTRRYEETVQQLGLVVEELFSSTDDLRTLSGDVFTRNVRLVEAARFLVAPPISADDLKTLLGGNIGSKRPNAERAESAARIVRTAWDPLRFPWIAENRAPTADERRIAISWTSSIWAIESMRTYQRNTSARLQEAAVSAVIERAGFAPVNARKIEALEELPRGNFTSGECRLGDHKCDRAVRLHDGRLLAIECKVSNSAVNSKKRLNNDVGAKARSWRQAYGEQVIPAAVLAGVYSLGNLITAQDHDGIALFWAHELAPLTTFIEDARAGT